MGLIIYISIRYIQFNCLLTILFIYCIIQISLQYKDIYSIPTPDLGSNKSVYSEIVQYYNMSVEERIILLLSLDRQTQTLIRKTDLLAFLHNEQHYIF